MTNQPATPVALFAKPQKSVDAGDYHCTADYAGRYYGIMCDCLNDNTQTAGSKQKCDKSRSKLLNEREYLCTLLQYVTVFCLPFPLSHDAISPIRNEEIVLSELRRRRKRSFAVDRNPSR